MREYKLSELVARFGGELIGDDIMVSGVAPTNLAKLGQLTFLADAKYKKDLLTTTASAVVLLAKDAENVTNLPQVINNNPYWFFSKVSQLFNPRRLLKNGIMASVVMGEMVDVGENPSIADYVVVGDNVVIGNNCQIHSHVVLGNNIKIGENVTIYPNVTIYDNITIGDNCVLHSGAVIGADGFGNAQGNDKSFTRIPQIGGVIIGNDVDIGANTTVDCGTFSPTIIEDGVKIDNLVQIAHNVVIGAYTGIAACVGIAGSTQIGKYCQLGGGCLITGHIKIADHTVIGAATGVSKSVTKPDLYFSAYPFSTLKEWARNAVHVKNLHSMYQRLRELEKKFENIGEK
jgi:UDP-3-O-[3-hydroxymyristoyl] glucosamine N-acyltransferase